jgi:hypothetical protein
MPPLLAPLGRVYADWRSRFDARMRYGRGRLVAAMQAVFAKMIMVQWHLRRSPPRTLFVLGHMRSGSSLLVHILGSHPEVRALGESWLQYDDAAKLEELVVLVHAAHRSPFVTEKYVVDKILHDELLPGEALLRRADVFAIFLVREPARSLVSLVSNKERLRSISGWDTAALHYESRLGRLVEQARVIGDSRRSLLVRYEQLIGDPEPCLESIRIFLGLSSPLTREYRTNRFTGVAGLGDFSEHIKSGTIIRTKPPAEMQVPPEILARANLAHATCLAALQEVCTTQAG